jgi:hypothetical protein
MMRNQRGIALTSVLLWGVAIVLLAVFFMKVLPTGIEYFKIMKDTKAVVTQVGPNATVAEIKETYRRFAEIDQLTLKAEELDISKDNGQIVIAFAYERRIPLVANVSLLIEYQGSTAGQ